MSEIRKLRLKHSPELHPRIALLFAQMEAVRADLKKLVGKLDPARLEEKPVANFFSAAGVLAHVAETEAWWTEVVIHKRGEGNRLPRGWCAPLAEEEGGEPVIAGRPLSEYLALLDRIRAQTFELLKTYTAEDLTRVFDYHSSEGDDYDFDLEWILQHLVEHEAHHRGQLVLLNRMLSAR